MKKKEKTKKRDGVAEYVAPRINCTDVHFECNILQSSERESITGETNPFDLDDFKDSDW